MAKVGAGQEKLQFGEKLKISADSDPSRARVAATRRRKRLGRLALTPRTKGFRQRTGGLWVPTSGTENTSVVTIPEVKVKLDKDMVRDKVYEKYQGTDVSLDRVSLWAHFAAMNTEQGLRQKFRSYRESAGVNCLSLLDAVKLTGGEIDRETIEGHQLAMPALVNYVVALETFVGAPEILGTKNQRKWPQQRHARDYQKRTERAEEMLDALPEHRFDEWVEEAFYSNHSRHLFWKRVGEAYDAYRAEHRLLEPDYLQVPLEACEHTPEYNAVSVVA